MSEAITSPQVEINGLSIAIIPNSFEFDEGLGEQTVKSQSAGGGSVEQVFFDDSETKFSMVKFDLYNTASNIELARIWKTSKNRNNINITDGADSDFSRTVKEAAVTNNYAVPLKNEGNISIELHGRPAV